MQLSGMMRRQCYQRSSILGWSVYDVFLDNYFAYFPPQQLLVQYTEDLEAQPLAVLRAVESHIGVPHHEYNETQVSTVYNARGCYKWRCGKSQSDVPSMQGTALGASEAEFDAAVRQLVDFLRPHMHRLFRWADEGRISQVPQAWRHMYT
ncbi:hypothetical protein HYH02_011418 [Chlamydomonas schloesseri]|uniref:Sulfotransferase n=1 Tax=Chlamydomonas schloesseri TaxID=2026947 RepID=A0A835TEW7_9CHLO|nr:hypothetical protein HYH02_011418 [Chlamydomonas schloesseri]|eukprot:KAG2436986.1 hypothetical protein HYH02_011418 [Chlamydomonas schloesseri]